jgi:hypothetical protein
MLALHCTISGNAMKRTVAEPARTITHTKTPVIAHLPPAHPALGQRAESAGGKPTVVERPNERVTKEKGRGRSTNYEVTQVGITNFFTPYPPSTT